MMEIADVDKEESPYFQLDDVTKQEQTECTIIMNNYTVENKVIWSVSMEDTNGCGVETKPVNSTSSLNKNLCEQLPNKSEDSVPQSQIREIVDDIASLQNDSDPETAAVLEDIQCVDMDNSTVLASAIVVENEVANGYITHEEPPINHQVLMQHTSKGKRALTCCSCIWSAAIPLLLIVMTWILFALPTVFYALRLLNEVESTTNSPATFSNGSETGCFPRVTYSGSVCQSELRNWQECFSGEVLSNEDVFVHSNVDQDTVEGNARSLLELGLPFVNPSPECEAAIKPFMCIYLFGLCDTDGQFHQALQEDCVRVRDEICQREWNTAMDLLQTNPDLGSLPQCEELPSETSNCFQQDNMTNAKQRNSMEDSMEFSGNTTMIECSEGFYLNDGNSCRPECGVWRHPDFISDKVLEKWIIIFSLLVALVCSVLFIIITAICQRKVVWMFPSIYLVYVMLISFVIAVTLMIGTTSQTALFCHSRDLIETFETATPYCTITGIVYYYGLLQITMWLLFHSGGLFWGIVFPFHYRRWKKEDKIKYIHITTVILALLVPAISPLTALLKDGFVSFSSPNYVCLGRNSDVSFATLVLPISIFAATASSMLIIIFWTILKHFIIKKLSKVKIKLQVGKAEVKIMIILCFYILLGVFGLIVFTFANATREANITSLGDYFLCESLGREDCDTLTTSHFPVLGQLSVVAYLLQGLLPVIVLVFGLNTKKVNVKRQLGSLRTLSSTLKKKTTRSTIRSTS